jgi:hypothetical protein
LCSRRQVSHCTNPFSRAVPKRRPQPKRWQMLGGTFARYSALRRLAEAAFRRLRRASWHARSPHVWYGAFLGRSHSTRPSHHVGRGLDGRTTRLRFFTGTPIGALHLGAQDRRPSSNSCSSLAYSPTPVWCRAGARVASGLCLSRRRDRRAPSQRTAHRRSLRFKPLMPLSTRWLESVSIYKSKMNCLGAHSLSYLAFLLSESASLFVRKIKVVNGHVASLRMYCTTVSNI